jgi:DNA-binding MarR family transcriptional regulator/GNAT superfamily N-acetyltransferase
MLPDDIEGRADTVRLFNRFYLHQMVVLDEHVAQTGYSLTEVRILYDLANRAELTASDLRRHLGLNAGYLSHLIGGFEKSGLIEKVRSDADARVIQLRLTEKGREVFQPLNRAAQSGAKAMLGRMSEPEQRQLLDSMCRVQDLLGERDASFVLRDPRPGDMGWIIHRHGALFSQDYQDKAKYEAHLCGLAENYLSESDRSVNCCLVAERNGQVAGAIAVLRDEPRSARLGMFYVEPSARRLGIGGRLMAEAVRFASVSGYDRAIITLEGNFQGARRIFQKAGFTQGRAEARAEGGYAGPNREHWERDL